MGTRDKPPAYDDGDMGLDLDEEDGIKDKLELPPAIKPKLNMSSPPPKTASSTTKPSSKTPRSAPPKAITPRTAKPPPTSKAQPKPARNSSSSSSFPSLPDSPPFNYDEEERAPKISTNSTKEIQLKNEQIERLEALNHALMIQLEDKDKQMAQVYQETNIENIDDLTDSAAKVKITSLVKKTKALSIALEKEKTKNSKLQAELSGTEKIEKIEKIEKKSNNSPSFARPSKPLQHSPSLSSPSNAESEREIQELKDANIRLTKQMSELKDKLLVSEKEIKSLKRALQRELGDGVDITKVLDETNGSWKGRAQQISLLKAKISELSSSTDPKQRSSVGGSSIDEGHREEIAQLAADRRQEFEKLIQENESIKEEFHRQKLKIDAKESRIKILEAKSQDLQEKMKIVLDKTKDDDQLIALLKKEIAKLKAGNSIIEKRIY